MPKTIGGVSQREYHRRWRAKNKDKVRKALKDTVDDRVERNKAHRKAKKRLGRTNFDVHHPKGMGGPTRIVGRHHGRDKK